jgi:hypothetical protein
MASLGFLLDRATIVALAVIGAAIATLGNVLLHRNPGGRHRSGRLLLRWGYALTGASVVLFIIAGFMSNR